MILTALAALALTGGMIAGALKLSENASPALLHLAQDHRVLLQAFILLLMLMTILLLVGDRNRRQND